LYFYAEFSQALNILSNTRFAISSVWKRINFPFVFGRPNIENVPRLASFNEILTPFKYFFFVFKLFLNFKHHI